MGWRSTLRYFVYTANSNNTLSVIRLGISVHQVPARNGAYAVAVINGATNAVTHTTAPSPA